MEEIVKNMQFPLREKDEFYSFRKIFQYYKKNYREIVESMLKNMSEENRKVFIDMLQSKIVDPNETIVRKIVKVVKKKDDM